MGHPVGFVAATMMPFSRRSPHSISISASFEKRVGEEGLGFKTMRSRQASCQPLIHPFEIQKSPISKPIRRFPKAISAALAIGAITGRIACRSSIALVVTPEGLPLAYEVLPGNTARQRCCPATLPGNTSDKTTLRGFLERIERQYGKARRVWLMDRGVPTEEVLAEMRTADPPRRAA
jgi:hypothetical protein